LAQVADDPDGGADTPPTNDNVPDAPPASEPTITDQTVFDDKIKLLTDAAEGGLDAKQAWILDKLKHYSVTKLIEFKALVEKCYDETDLAKEVAAEKLSVAFDKSSTDLKKCRTDYIDALLVRKEEIKGELESVLNQTIHNIKALKVDVALGEAGMPTKDHKSTIES
jgi:hypothetical protein